jgi:hypothetical protein
MQLHQRLHAHACRTQNAITNYDMAGAAWHMICDPDVLVLNINQIINRCFKLTCRLYTLVWLLFLCVCN